jgi:hypothetical protein
MLASCFQFQGQPESQARSQHKAALLVAVQSWRCRRCISPKLVFTSIRLQHNIAEAIIVQVHSVNSPSPLCNNVEIGFAALTMVVMKRSTFWDITHFQNQPSFRRKTPPPLSGPKNKVNNKLTWSRHNLIHSWHLLHVCLTVETTCSSETTLDFERTVNNL